MLKTHHRPPYVMLILSALFFAFFSLAWVQGETSDLKGQAIPLTSRKIITLKITLSDKSIATITQFDGETIRHQRNGLAIGLIPRILSAENNIVQVDFVRLDSLNKDNVQYCGGINSVESTVLTNFSPQPSPINLLSSIQLLNISELNKDLDMKILTENCCVTCNGQQTCGLCVELACGRCGDCSKE